jgi:hypothetical protein
MGKGKTKKALLKINLVCAILVLYLKRKFTLQKGRMMKRTILVFALGLLVAVGCGQSASVPNTGTPQSTSTGEHAEHSHEHTVNGWCVEHGVPEAKCSICDKKAADEFKKNGDWCKEHDRAESQCFICNPQAQEKFAAEYKAQFGTDLPKPHTH